MQQIDLIHEDIYEALRTCVQALGGAKKVGPMFWGELTPDKAGNRLSDCLNRDRREQLNPEQILLILRLAAEADCHAAIYYLADECHYERPRRINPVTEEQKLQRECIAAVEKMEQLLKRQELLREL